MLLALRPQAHTHTPASAPQPGAPAPCSAPGHPHLVTGCAPAQHHPPHQRTPAAQVVQDNHQHQQWRCPPCLHMQLLLCCLCRQHLPAEACPQCHCHEGWAVDCCLHCRGRPPGVLQLYQVGWLLCRACCFCPTETQAGCCCSCLLVTMPRAPAGNMQHGPGEGRQGSTWQCSSEN
jgi:hypothetical protein